MCQEEIALPRNILGPGSSLKIVEEKRKTRKIGEVSGGSMDVSNFFRRFLKIIDLGHLSGNKTAYGLRAFRCPLL